MTSTRTFLGLLAGFVALSAFTALPASAKVPGPNGRIAFARLDPVLGELSTYTVNPDGSHVQPLVSSSEGPHWSPDGTEVQLSKACTDGAENCALTIANPDTGSFRQFRWPDPTLETDCGHWAPSGQRLACEGFGVTDPSRNGIYTIRSSDGGGLRRITTNPGGDDIPGDFSPNGKRLVFVRFNEDGPVGLFVVRLSDGGVRRITPRGMILDDDAGSWSPSGNRILFQARSAEDHRLAIWGVNADGSGLAELPITPTCGGAFSDPKAISCFEPGWSPDGTKIVFTRVSANGTQSNIYTVNADGSGLTRVTNSGGARDPEWGPHPIVS